MAILRNEIIVMILSVFIAFLLIGCGGSSVVITPNYSHPDLRSPGLKRGSVRIVKVSDGRAVKTSQIGTARVGMLNRKVPFILDGDIAEVVRTMLDTLIIGNHNQDQFLPVSVSVDMFEVGEGMKLFSEEGYFACNLRFSYPVNPDSIGQQVVFITQTEKSVVDVTNSIEPLIYKGMSACASQFVKGTLDKKQTKMMISSDSVSVIIVKDSVHTAASLHIESTKPKQVITTQSDKTETNEAAFQFAKGDKVVTGIRGSYNMLSQTKESPVLWGFGISLTYYNIENKEDYLKGSFINFAARLVGKYYLNNSNNAYIGGNLGIACGSERIDYGYNVETTFFFGPTIEEVLGFTIDRKISIEFGSFQLVHFGSKLLPSDVGFIIGMSFKI